MDELINLFEKIFKDLDDANNVAEKNLPNIRERHNVLCAINMAKYDVQSAKKWAESMQSRKTIANDIRTMPDETLAEFLSVIDINKCDKEWWLNYLKKEI